MKASKHPYYFLFVKLAQLLVCLIIVILEVTSYVTWSNYVDELNSSKFYPQINIDKSVYFKKQPLPTDKSITWLWNHALRLILMELFFFALWFSSGVANFDPWYSGPGLRCDLINTNSKHLELTKLAELAQLQCNTDVASISFGWINVGLYVISLLIARKRSSELDWANVRTYNSSQDSEENDNPRDSRRQSRGSRTFNLRNNGGGNRPVFF
ncbi:21073_t:CDS:2 [Rhizophagus irregularis]|nr:21073_t:CDS:2 [Rhizophagus irregularis]